MRYPVTRITMRTVGGLGPIVGRSALFIGPRNTCCGPICCAGCVESNI